MSPSRWAKSTRRAILVAAIAGAGAWTTSASAHPIAVARGAAVIDGTRVRITLCEAGESLIHEVPALHGRGDFSAAEVERAFAQRAEQLVARLEVRDGAGRLLIGRLTQSDLSPGAVEDGESSERPGDSPIRRVIAIDPPVDGYRAFSAWRGARATYELEYVAERPLTHVTLRQAPPGDAIIPTQFALRVQDRSNAAERFVRLTSAGNAETLDLSPSPPARVESDMSAGGRLREPAVIPPASMDRHRFKSIQAVIRQGPRRVLADVYLPLTLLETWGPIDREQADFVTPAEQHAACEAAVRLMREKVSLIESSREARSISPAALSCAVLGPDHAYLGDDMTQRCSRVVGAWSARVVVRFEFPVSPTESAITLDWRLFNPAVLTADLLIVSKATSSGMAEAREHQVTTYNPTVVLKIPAATLPKEPIARAIDPGE